jgi:hypothetical protein
VTRVLVLGIPRSGTTWIGRALAAAPDTSYLHEPDNDMSHPFALRAKGRLGRFPLLDPSDDAPGYERLWRAALGEDGKERGAVARLRDRAALSIGRRVPRPVMQQALSNPDTGRPAALRLASWLATPAAPGPGANAVVKTVHAPLAAEWIDARFDPAVVVVLRHPLNVLASLLELGLPDRDRALERRPGVPERVLRPLGIDPPEENASDAARAAWQVGMLQAALQAAAARHREWIVVEHEELAIGAIPAFRSLFERIGLPWSEDVAAHLEASNRPGTGFTTNRLGADEPARWRRRLRPDQFRDALRVLRTLPTDRWDLGEALASEGSA